MTDFESRWQRTVNSRPTARAHLFKHVPSSVAPDGYVALCDGDYAMSPLSLEEVDAAWPKCKVCDKCGADQ